MKKITIGITDCARYAEYERWMKIEPGVEIIRLGYMENNLYELEKCDGIILSGGEDIHPSLYHKPEYIDYCHADNMDIKRDEFEWEALHSSQDKNLPVLGICRGLQLVNIFYKGTLIPEILDYGKEDHTKFNESHDRYHTVKVMPQTLLHKIVGTASGTVNSSHHQGIDKIGQGLTVNSFSEDGIIEGLERMDPGKSPFLLLVQWHPERMMDSQSPFSKNIKNRFLEAVRNENIKSQ